MKDPQTTDSRIYWVLMQIQIPDTLGWEGEHPDSPCGFLPVFDSEPAAMIHAGDMYLVHPIRMVPPDASRNAPQPATGAEGR